MREVLELSCCGDRLSRCSTLPGSDMMDRLEMVLPPPSTKVGVAEPRVAVEEMGPGNKMSPDMIGRESTEGKIRCIINFSKDVFETALPTVSDEVKLVG